jgi:hypothetical protein
MGPAQPEIAATLRTGDGERIMLDNVYAKVIRTDEG